MSDTVNLTKGERVDLTKDGSLKVATVGLGWDVNAGNSGSFDLDAFAVLLRAGKFTSGDDIIYFGKLTGPGIKHNGDNLTGAGDGDDEQIEITFASVPDDVDQIIIAVNIYQADSKNQRFGMVNNAFIRIVDKDTNAELARFDLTEDGGQKTAMVFGKLYRNNGDWKFQALGEGHSTDINGVAQLFK